MKNVKRRFTLCFQSASILIILNVISFFQPFIPVSSSFSQIFFDNLPLLQVILSLSILVHLYFIHKEWKRDPSWKSTEGE